MNIRDWLEQHSTAATLIALVAITIAVGALVFRFRGPPDVKPPQSFYYFDLNTGKLFAGPAEVAPPVDTPSGPHQGQPAGVRVYVAACGECPAELEGAGLPELERAGAFILRMERFTPAAKAKMSSPAGPGGGASALMTQAMNPGYQVKLPEDEQWYSLSSPAGQQRLNDAATRRCPDGSTPTLCFPD